MIRCCGVCGIIAVGDATDRQNCVVLDGDPQRITRPDPGPEYLRRLVAQPPLQNGRSFP
jgi:hypothetical protein